VKLRRSFEPFTSAWTWRKRSDFAIGGTSLRAEAGASRIAKRSCRIRISTLTYRPSPDRYRGAVAQLGFHCPSCIWNPAGA
jgi:hypothetical protein